MALSADEIVFCNKMLGLLGEDVITASDTAAKAYVQSELYLDDTLDEIVGGHPWNAAKARAMLIQDATQSPLFGYDYAYTKPTTALRIWKPRYWDYAYRVEGGLVVTSEGGLPDAWLTATTYAVSFVVRNGANDTAYECISAHTAGDLDDEPGVGAVEATYWTSKGDGLYILDVEYIKQLTVTTLPWNLNASVQLALAAAVSAAIKDDEGKTADRMLTRLHQVVLPLARFNDAQEGSTKVGLETSYWLDARTTDV